MRARESAESINYRARIKGTSNYSASDLVALLQSWVQSGEASINIQSIHYNLDQSCETALDNIYALNCGSQPLTLPSPSNGTKSPTEPPTKGPTEDKNVGSKDNSGDSISTEMGGIIFGGIIAGALLTIVVFLVVVTIIWTKSFK